jgi:hypothetical protein
MIGDLDDRAPQVLGSDSIVIALELPESPHLCESKRLVRWQFVDELDAREPAEGDVPAAIRMPPFGGDGTDGQHRVNGWPTLVVALVARLERSESHQSRASDTVLGERTIARLEQVQRHENAREQHRSRQREDGQTVEDGVAQLWGRRGVSIHSATR